MKLLLIVAATMVLASCGGGADTPSVTTNSALDPAASAAIIGFLDTSNLASTGFPFNGQYPGVTKRWNLPIPVKTNGEARAAPAMDAIEAKLGYVVFDRTSLANIDEANIVRGVVFRQGTSYLPAGANPQSYCANVSNAPFSGGWPANMLTAPGVLSARCYVNLDNPQCTASADIVIHEIGHALGMAIHFRGFGDGPAISSDFWNVMATLYANPPGTAKANIVVKQSH